MLPEELEGEEEDVQDLLVVREVIAAHQYLSRDSSAEACCCTHILTSDALGRYGVSVSVTYPVLVIVTAIVAITILVEGRRVPVKDSRLAAGSRLIAE